MDTNSREYLFHRIGYLESQVDALIEAIEKASLRVEIPHEIASVAEMVARGRGGRGKHDLRLATERQRKDAAKARKREQKERIDATNRALKWGYTAPAAGSLGGGK